MAQANKQPKYRQIYQDLKHKIEQVEFPHASFLPAERVLSELYQVERPTVRHALQLLADEGFIEKCIGAGNRIIYQGKQVDENAHQYTRTIVYVLPDSIGEQGPQPYHEEVCMELDKLCAQYGYGLIMTKARAVDENMPQWMYSRSVVGAIWVSDVNPPLLEAAKALGIPSVLCSNNRTDFPTINVDDFTAGYQATRHLAQQGCRHIVHITGMKSYPASRRRMEGYRHALLATGMPFSVADVYTGDWSYQTAYDLTMQFLKNDPSIDGIYVANDPMAVGVIDAARKLGFDMPARLKIVGTDNIKSGRTLEVPLSTVSFSKSEFAKCLFNTLYAVLHKFPVPNEVIMPAKLVVRASSVGNKE